MALANCYSAPEPPRVPPPFDASRGERLVWDLDGPDGADRRWRRHVFEHLPDALGAEIADQYRHLWGSDGRRAANLMLLHIRERLAGYRPSTLWHTFRDEDLRGFARRKAERNARRFLAPRDPVALYGALCVDACRIGVDPPQVGVQGVTLWGALRRLCDDYWWRRALRRGAGRALEATARDSGFVHRYARPYVSQGTFNRVRSQHHRNSALLECIEAENELGDTFSLAQLREWSVANPTNRRHELMCRLAGFEQIADERGDVGEFITLTCPSRYHCRRSKDGRAVETYQGATPREGQAYLRAVWARIRSALKRRGIVVYGMRMAEPNHDGTPHWHLVLFAAPKTRAVTRDVVRRYALQDAGEEPGAVRHRVKFEAIDRSRGSAVSYAAKYVSKGIDGHGLDATSEGIEPSEKAQRIKAWAATWGIRQFQQVGGPPVSVWRELRRAVEAPTECLERIRAAADAGDWAEFTRVMGGPTALAAERPVHLARAWDDSLGRYEEPKGLRTFGVAAGPVTVVTRVHSWNFRYRPDGDGVTVAPGNAIENARLDHSEAGPDCAPWSSVNNCTRRSVDELHRTISSSTTSQIHQYVTRICNCTNSLYLLGTRDGNTPL